MRGRFAASFMISAVFALWARTASAQVTVLNVNFDSYTVGEQIPGTDGSIVWNKINVNDTNLKATIQPSQIGGGGAGNNALEMDDTAATGVTPNDMDLAEAGVLSNWNGGDGVSTGTVEFDHRTLELRDAAFQFNRILLESQVWVSGNPDALAITQIWFENDGRVTLRTGDQGTVTLIASYAVGTDYHFKIEFDSTARTFTVTVSGGASFGPAQYQFQGAQASGLKSWRVVTGTGKVPHFQIDNLVVTDTTVSRVEGWWMLQP